MWRRTSSHACGPPCCHSIPGSSTLDDPLSLFWTCCVGTKYLHGSRYEALPLATDASSCGGPCAPEAAAWGKTIRTTAFISSCAFILTDLGFTIGAPSARITAATNALNHQIDISPRCRNDSGMRISARRESTTTARPSRRTVRRLR